MVFGAKESDRRSVLGLSLAVTAGLLLASNARPAHAALPASGLPAGVGTAAPAAAAVAVWAKSLQTLQPARGVTKTFNDVYVMTSISQVVSISTRSGAMRLAITMTGKSNQLQIIDPLGGIREKVITIPDNLIARGLAWDTKNRTLYIGITTGRILGYHYDTGKLTDLGRVAPKATSLYGLAVDSTGRLWGGSYPEGVVWNYTPKTKKFAHLPRIDNKSDYVRGLDIDADDIVYVGTGTTAPKVVSFPAAKPTRRTTLKLTALPKVGFVNKITAHGDHILINADSVTTQLIWNRRTKKVTTAALSKAQRQTGGTRKEHLHYWVSGKALYSTDAKAGKDTRLGNLEVLAPDHIWTANGSVYILDRQGPTVRTHRFNLKTGKSTLQASTKLKGAGVGVHSIMANTDGKLYIGGYQGEGIATLNPTTGARWQSLDTVAPNQIEGMIQWSPGKTYIGSYGSADIIRFTTTRAPEGNIAFKRMERLLTNYGQSRPFGWAKNSRRVFFGTVPDYGLAGGALGIINPATDSIEAVYNKIIPNHSIIGLAADDKFVYGTTSTRNGYGIPDTRGNAKVFAFNLATKKLAWSRDIPGFTSVYDPILVDGKIVAATIEGVVVLNASNGILAHNHSFTGRQDRHYRPGWLNAGLARIGDSRRFVHAGGFGVHVIDLQKGTLRKAEGTTKTGSAVAVMPDGRVFVNYGVRGIAQIDVEPVRPDIASTADLVSVSASGLLTVRPSNGRGVWGSPKKLGTGWNAKAVKSLHVVDWQSRGVMDLLVQRKDGTLTLHQANGDGKYPLAGKDLPGKWGPRQITVGRVSAIANEPAMVSTDAAGNLYLHEIIKSTGALRSAKRIGTGFTGYNLSLVDVRGKGYADLIGHKGGSLYWWQNRGNKTLTGRKVLRTGGWSGMTHISAAKRHYGQYEGLVYRVASGEMRYISAKSGTLAGIIGSKVLLKKDVVAGG